MSLRHGELGAATTPTSAGPMPYQAPNWSTLACVVKPTIDDEGDSPRRLSPYHLERGIGAEQASADAPDCAALPDVSFPAPLACRPLQYIL